MSRRVVTAVWSWLRGCFTSGAAHWVHASPGIQFTLAVSDEKPAHTD